MDDGTFVLFSGPSNRSTGFAWTCVTLAVSELVAYEHVECIPSYHVPRGLSRSLLLTSEASLTCFAALLTTGFGWDLGKKHNTNG